jgi:hypothetical protein
MFSYCTRRRLLVLGVELSGPQERTVAGGEVFNRKCEYVVEKGRPMCMEFRIHRVEYQIAAAEVQVRETARVTLAR